jgi:hypothetical protein
MLPSKHKAQYWVGRGGRKKPKILECDNVESMSNKIKISEVRINKGRGHIIQFSSLRKLTVS